MRNEQIEDIEMAIPIRVVKLLILVGMITACNTRISQPTEPSIIPSTSLTEQILTPEPTNSPLSPITEIIVTPTQSSSVPISTLPTISILENGLTWRECVLPNREYFYTKSDIELATNCLGLNLPFWDDNDKKMFEERLQGENGGNLRLVIGNDIYETRYTVAETRVYELLKNGSIFASASAFFVTFDPNRHLLNIDGKAVWEVISDPPVVIGDGINFNEEFQLEGSFFPYAIDNKLIYIARKNGKFFIVYDGKNIGPEFDEISMAYCCAKISVRYGQGQYWFWGKRDGIQFVIAIY